MLPSCRSLTSLCLFLHTCDSNLVVRRGKPEEVVADLIKHLGSVSTVAFHEEVGSPRSHAPSLQDPTDRADAVAASMHR